MNSIFRSHLFCAVILLSALSGCTTLGAKAVTEPPAVVVAQSVRDLYQAANIKIPEKGATATEPATIEPAIFAQAGYRAVFVSCNAYFDAIVKASNKLKMTKADLTAIGSAAAVIATLAEAAEKEIGIIAAAFGLGVVAVENYEQYAFATPYPIQTRDLVLKALSAYRDSSDPKDVDSLSDAADKIAGYANICTYSGIAGLSAEAIAKATPGDISKPASLFTKAERTQYLQPVNAVLGIAEGVVLTDNDYVTLAAIVDPNATTETLNALVKTFSSNIPEDVVKDKLYDATTSSKKSVGLDAIRSLLLPVLTQNSEFAKQVEAKKQAVTAKVSPPAQPPKVRQPLIGIVSY